jgi:hypothetical protein
MKNNHKLRMMAFAFTACSLISAAAGSAAVFAQEETAETPVVETPAAEITAETAENTNSEGNTAENTEESKPEETPAETERAIANLYYVCVDEDGNLLKKEFYMDWSVDLGSYVYFTDSIIPDVLHIDGYELIDKNGYYGGFFNVKEGYNEGVFTYRKINAEAPAESTDKSDDIVDTETPAENEEKKEEVVLGHASGAVIDIDTGEQLARGWYGDINGIPVGEEMTVTPLDVKLGPSGLYVIQQEYEPVPGQSKTLVITEGYDNVADFYWRKKGSTTTIEAVTPETSTEETEKTEASTEETVKTETAEGADKTASVETEKAAESKTETAGTTASGTKTDTKAAASTGSASSSAKKNTVNTAAGGELAMFSALGTSAIAAVTAMIKARKAKGRF